MPFAIKCMLWLNRIQHAHTKSFPFRNQLRFCCCCSSSIFQYLHFGAGERFYLVWTSCHVKSTYIILTHFFVKVHVTSMIEYATCTNTHLLHMFLIDSTIFLFAPFYSTHLLCTEHIILLFIACIKFKSIYILWNCYHTRHTSRKYFHFRVHLICR